MFTEILLKNDNKIVKWCKNGKLLKKMVTKPEHVTKNGIKMLIKW